EDAAKQVLPHLYRLLRLQGALATPDPRHRRLQRTRSAPTRLAPGSGLHRQERRHRRIRCHSHHPPTEPSQESLDRDRPPALTKLCHVPAIRRRPRMGHPQAHLVQQAAPTPPPALEMGPHPLPHDALRLQFPQHRPQNVRLHNRSPAAPHSAPRPALQPNLQPLRTARLPLPRRRLLRRSALGQRHSGNGHHRDRNAQQHQTRLGQGTPPRHYRHSDRPQTPLRRRRRHHRRWNPAQHRRQIHLERRHDRGRAQRRLRHGLRGCLVDFGSGRHGADGVSDLEADAQGRGERSRAPALRVREGAYGGGAAVAVDEH
ncbi:hypothetical protein LTR32_007799, partial [Rachicladosporium monterosium]